MKEYNWVESHNCNKYGRISAINCDIRIACAIESMYIQGFANEEIGDQETFDYYALFLEKKKGYILTANSQGFIYVKEFESKSEAQETFDKINKEYSDLLVNQEQKHYIKGLIKNNGYGNIFPVGIRNGHGIALSIWFKTLKELKLKPHYAYYVHTICSKEGVKKERRRYIDVDLLTLKQFQV